MFNNEKPYILFNLICSAPYRFFYLYSLAVDIRHKHSIAIPSYRNINTLKYNSEILPNMQFLKLMAVLPSESLRACVSLVCRKGTWSL